MSVCLIDTSIFCVLLEVPNRCQGLEEALAEMEQKVSAGEFLLLPMSTILETGNHIGQQGDGRQRRAAAGRFVAQVQQALRGEAPFTPTRFFEPEELLRWLDEFPDWAGQGIGLADLTIQKEWDRQRALNKARRVYIWSRDQHLAAYDQTP